VAVLTKEDLQGVKIHFGSWNKMFVVTNPEIMVI